MANKTIVDLETNLVKPYIDNKDKEIYKAMGELGAKNLLPNAFSDKTIGGLAVTVDDNGVISIANGTANASGSLSSGTLNNYLPAGKYIVSLGDNTGKITNNGTFNIKGHTTNSDTIVTFVTFNYNQVNEKAFTINKDYIITEIYININSGMVFADGVVFYPMLRLASIEDDTYEPYTKTNQQLTKETTGLIDNDFANGAVNCCNFDVVTQTVKGYTFTNNNGVIHVTGSRTSGQTGNVDYHKTISLKAGTYKLTGCPMGGSANTWRLLLDINNGAKYVFDYGDGKEFTLDADSNNVIVYCTIMSNYSDSVNMYFKPMISLASLNLNYDDYVPYAKTNKELTEDAVALRTGKINGFVLVANSQTTANIFDIISDPNTYPENTIYWGGTDRITNGAETLVNLLDIGTGVVEIHKITEWFIGIHIFGGGGGRVAFATVNKNNTSIPFVCVYPNSSPQLSIKTINKAT